MGTMRNNFAAVFVLHILMHLTSQSLPLRATDENSSKRNSLSELRSTSSPAIYECLFLDPDLPICDEELMLKLAEDSSSDQDNFGENNGRRSTRNVHVSTTDVIVYTIEGCLPSKIPFSMPSCEGISLDKIVDVQKFRPFVVKGVTKPPFVFPKFNYREWQRMMTRLKNHVSSHTQFEKEEESIGTSEEASSSSVDRSVIQDRKQELMKAATKKEMMPNMIAVNTTNSNDSSPNNTRILDNSKVGKWVVDRAAARTSEEFSNIGGIVSRTGPTSASVENRSSFQFRDRIDNESRKRSKFNVGENPEIVAFPNTIPPPPHNPLAPPPELSSNELLNYHNSAQSNIPSEHGGIAPDFPFKKMMVETLGRRRRLPARNTTSTNNGIDDESRPPRPRDSGTKKNQRFEFNL